MSGILLLVVAIAALATACGGDDDDGKATPEPESRYRGVLVEPAFPKPEVTLTDTDGRPFDLRKETEGYLTLLYLGYTHCPDVCPTHMLDLGASLKKLPAEVTDQIKVVFVTVDPERDTAERLKDWLSAFHPAFIGLYGDATATGALLESLSMPPTQKTDLGGGNYAVSHAAYVMAFTNDNLAHIVYPFGVTRDDWTHDLPVLVKEGWIPDDQATRSTDALATPCPDDPGASVRR